MRKGRLVYLELAEADWILLPAHDMRTNTMIGRDLPEWSSYSYGSSSTAANRDSLTAKAAITTLFIILFIDIASTAHSFAYMLSGSYTVS